MTTPHADRDHSEKPSFEAMLADHVGQYDPRAEVLASIVDWTNAPSSTMAGSAPRQPGTSRFVAARATPAQVEAARAAIYRHQHDRATRVAGGWTCRCGEFVSDSSALWSHIECEVADAVVAAGRVDGAAAMQETGEHPAGGDAAVETVHDEAGAIVTSRDGDGA
ncbi:hypothetical protein [Intrasporangium flavum]|uniref:hypothetical protein n=1 Tax=Intrasporangium flavum TaxID=1428657 RepID=UPI00096F3E0C|nr:hypothetical protein [Intrasporangium flavum]